MSIKSGILNLLTSATTVSAIVSDRVGPAPISQDDDVPAITVEAISGPREYDASGALGFVGGRFQITSWDDTDADAYTLATAVRKVMDTTGTWDGTVVRGVFLDDEGEMPAPAEGFEGLARYGVRQDYIIWFREATS